MTARIQQLGQFCLLLVAAIAFVACAILGSGDPPPEKSSGVEFHAPTNPFSESPLAGGADKAWQSSKTGSTIAFNSHCEKGRDMSLEGLQKGILNGIENFKIEKRSSYSIKGGEGERISGTGTAEDIEIKMDIVIMRKETCSYDLVYISRAKAFSQELAHFEKFLERFKIP